MTLRLLKERKVKMNNKIRGIVSSPQFPIYILSLIVATLNSCILSPIYIQIENNITFEYTPLPIIFNYVILLFDVIYIALLFAAVSFSVYSIHKGIEKKSNTVVLTLAIVFLKHVLNLIASSIIDSYIDVYFDVPMTIYLIVIDLLILSVVAITANHFSKKHFAHARAMLKASKYLETVEYNETDDVFPFKGFWRFKNHPVLLPVFVGAVISAGLFVIQRLFADFVVLAAPSSFAEIIDITISYASDIIHGLIAYAVSYFAASYIFLKHIEKK